ncbi:MAG: NAD(P)-binding protein [Anaerolineae bacterium]
MGISTIRIAGAGLAGLAAAVRLAQWGHPVEVFEKNADSGLARHADWDAMENWTTERDLMDLLGDWGLAPSFAHRAPLDFAIYDAAGERYPFHTVYPFFYLIQRGPGSGSIEQALKQQAFDCGVVLHYGCPVDRSNVDIWAVGARSRGFFLGAGVTFHTRHPDTVIGLVDNSVAPRAYAYLVIVDGLGTLSVVLTRDFKNARSYLNRAIEFYQTVLPLEMENVRMTSGYGGRVQGLQETSTQRPLVVGEAAGLQDFLWGFGIRNALHSGYLAARALHEDTDYADLVAREIHPLVRSSIVNRMFYDRAGNRTCRALLRRFRSAPNLDRSIGFWYRGSALHRLLWPLAARLYRSQ